VDALTRQLWEQLKVEAGKDPVYTFAEVASGKLPLTRNWSRADLVAAAKGNALSPLGDYYEGRATSDRRVAMRDLLQKLLDGQGAELNGKEVASSTIAVRVEKDLSVRIEFRMDLVFPVGRSNLREKRRLTDE